MKKLKNSYNADFLGYKVNIIFWAEKLRSSQICGTKVGMTYKNGVNDPNCRYFQVQYCCHRKKILQLESGVVLNPNWINPVAPSCSPTASFSAAGASDTFVTRWIRINSDNFQPPTSVFQKGIFQFFQVIFVS